MAKLCLSTYVYAIQIGFCHYTVPWPIGGQTVLSLLKFSIALVFVLVILFYFVIFVVVVHSGHLFLDGASDPVSISQRCYDL